MGFFWGAWIPSYSVKGDILRLQKLNQAVNFNEISAARPEGETIKKICGIRMASGFEENWVFLFLTSKSTLTTQTDQGPRIITAIFSTLHYSLSDYEQIEWPSVLSIPDIVEWLQRSLIKLNQLATYCCCYVTAQSITR